jgi:hypothetical protein
MSGRNGGRALLGWMAGIISAIIAGLAVTWLTTNEGPAGQPKAEPTAVAYTPAASVDFLIVDELGASQLTEQVAVVIAGRSVGTLTVDVVHRTASLTVTVPTAGTYEYEVRSTTVFQDNNGDAFELTGVGHGQLRVSAGRSFAVVGELLDDKILHVKLQ